MTDTADPSALDELYSNFQNRLISVLPGIFATPSWIGSGLISYVILRERSQLLQRPYHRLILGLSVSDFVYSLQFTFFSGSWHIPTEASFVVGARAETLAWCNLQGTIIAATNIWINLYTACLMVFFLLRLVWNCREQFIAKRIEPWMHGFTLLVGAVFGAATVGTKTINPTAQIPGICFVTNFPVNCHVIDGDDNECRHSVMAIDLLQLVGFFVGMLGAFTMIVSLVLLTRKVWTMEQRMRQYVGGQLSQQLTQTRDTGIRALLYLASYLSFVLVAIVGVLLVEDVSRENRTTQFVFAILFSVVATNQGTWNAIIYLRPRFRELVGEEGTLCFLHGVASSFERFACCRYLWSCQCCFCGSVALVSRSGGSGSGQGRLSSVIAVSPADRHGSTAGSVVAGDPRNSGDASLFSNGSGANMLGAAQNKSESVEVELGQKREAEESPWLDTITVTTSSPAGPVRDNMELVVGESDDQTAMSDISTAENVASADARGGDSARETTIVLMLPRGQLGLDLLATPSGLVVESIAEDSPVGEELRPGDIVTSIEGVKTVNVTLDTVESLLFRARNEKRRFVVRRVLTEEEKGRDETNRTDQLK